jgi:hypothetical protein
VTANPEATVNYSATDGLTVIRGTTVDGIEVTHSPTKDEPWADVSVTIRTLGVVTIGRVFDDDPIETNDEAYAGELAEVREQNRRGREQLIAMANSLDEARALCSALNRELDGARSERDEARTNLGDMTALRDALGELNERLARELDDTKALAEQRGEALTRCEDERRAALVALDNAKSGQPRLP